RPGLLDAIATLYRVADQAHAADPAIAPPFVDERIRFHPVRAGDRRTDDDFLRDGRAAPALTVRVIGDPDDPSSPKISADRSRELASRACVAEIHALLLDGRAGNATLDGQPVAPGDIAVLVR